MFVNQLAWIKNLVFLCCCVLFNPCALNAGGPEMFHVEGTINSPWDSLPRGAAVARSKVKFDGRETLNTVKVDDKDSYVLVPRSEVTFQGQQANKTVVVDDNGFYQAELPFGLYKMVAHGPQIGSQALTEYVRVFYVPTTKSIVLNGALYIARNNCDALVSDQKGEDAEEGWKSICGGEDHFPLPSRDGAPLEVYVRYPQRQPTATGILYAKSVGWPNVPVFVAYNLFSLEADRVIYHSKGGTVEAIGNVIVADASGRTRRADSMTFRLKDGEAIPIQ